MNYKLRCSVALIALVGGGATPLYAQATSSDQGTVDSQAYPAEDSQNANEIIVTATKRGESLDKVPIQVSVFTEQAIQDAGISRAAAFLASIPNVTFIENNAGEAYVNIRGQTAVRNSDPNVAFVVDGVTLSTVKGFNQDLFDIQQIEVLKGPQSAIYGRNAAAGAIVINTKAPGSDYEGSILIGGGNAKSGRITGNVSGPITENLGFSLAGSFRHSDGTFTNVNTGEKVHRSTSVNGRIRLVYDDRNKLLVDFKFEGYRTHGGGLSYVAQLEGVPNGGYDGGPLDANNTNIPYTSDVTGGFNQRFLGGSLKIEYDFGFAKLTSVTGINNVREYFGSGSPPYLFLTDTVQQYTARDRNFSEEIRLTSENNQRLRWQVGFYILKFDRDQTNNVLQNTNSRLPDDPRAVYGPGSTWPTLAYGYQKYGTLSYAPFGNIQFDITPSLVLTMAGRYDTERRKVRDIAPADINPLTGASYNQCVAFTGQQIEDCHLTKTFHSFEPKVSLSYHLGGLGSVYASYGKGFKSGGFNPIGSRQALQAAAVGSGIDPNTVYVQPFYDKETSTSWELGTKLRLFNRSLSLTGAIFTTDIQGAQQFQFFPSVGLQTIVSIDRVRSRGFEVGVDWTSDFGLRLNGNYGYTQAKVKAFAANESFAGNTAPGSVKYTITAGASYEIDLGGDMTLTPRIEFNRYGPIWWDVANTAGTKRNPVNILNGRISLKSGDRWDLSAFANNISNTKYYQEITPLLGSFTVNYFAPLRTFGVEGRVNF